MTDLTNDEYNLIAVYRAIQEFGEHNIVGGDDASTLATYLPHLLDLDRVDAEIAVPLLLEGFVAGYAASRLVNAGLKPSEVAAATQKEVQTGVDTQGEIRVPTG